MVLTRGSFSRFPLLQKMKSPAASADSKSNIAGASSGSSSGSDKSTRSNSGGAAKLQPAFRDIAAQTAWKALFRDALQGRRAFRLQAFNRERNRPTQVYIVRHWIGDVISIVCQGEFYMSCYEGDVRWANQQKQYRVRGLKPSAQPCCTD